MDAPGGRDRGKELDPSVAHELVGQPKARVEGSSEWADPCQESARRDEPGQPRPASGEESVDPHQRRTEPMEGEHDSPVTGIGNAPDAPGGFEHP